MPLLFISLALLALACDLSDSVSSSTSSSGTEPQRSAQETDTIFIQQTIIIQHESGYRVQKITKNCADQYIVEVDGFIIVSGRNIVVKYKDETWTVNGVLEIPVFNENTVLISSPDDMNSYTLSFRFSSN